MNKTWKETNIKKLKSYGKRSRFCRWNARIAIYGVTICDAVLQYLSDNRKRICGLAGAWLFFAVSCSFALPGFVEVGEVSDGIENIGVNDAKERLISEFMEDEEAVIEDEDVLDGYEDTDLNNAAVDLFTVDEILTDGADAGESDWNGSEAENLSADAVTLQKDDWRLILINKQHPVPDDYTVELGTIKGNMKCDKRILGDLLAMMQEAREDGINLVVCSPFRDYSRQEVLFERKIKAYMGKGLSYMEAYMVSSQAVTVPGASEHQIGLALDIVCDTYTSLDEGFGETEAGKWLSANAHRFGFIQRYPKGREHITGIMYEPWHYRYVGRDAAAVIDEKNITLEELVEGL